jgi:hypothetical protein
LRLLARRPGTRYPRKKGGPTGFYQASRGSQYLANKYLQAPRKITCISSNSVEPGQMAWLHPLSTGFCIGSYISPRAKVGANENTQSVSKKKFDKNAWVLQSISCQGNIKPCLVSAEATATPSFKKNGYYSYSRGQFIVSLICRLLFQVQLVARRGKFFSVDLVPIVRCCS